MKTIGLVTLAMAGLAAGAPAEALWEIGAADNSGADLALGPSGYAKFEDDGFFALGYSDPRYDWPYVHPGPADAWAGGRAHAFVIVFDAQGATDEGSCRLALDLVDTHAGHPPALRIALNGMAFNRALPKGGGDASIHGQAAQGKEHIVAVTFPARQLRNGENEIVIENTEGSWLLYDAVRFEAPEGVRLTPGEKPVARIGDVTCPPVLVRRGDAMRQLVRVPVRHFGAPAAATLRVNDGPPERIALTPGPQRVEAAFPPVEQAQSVRVTLAIDGAPVAEREAEVRPVKPWTIYMLHHTHLDIGYTHVQTEVEQRQWDHLDHALDIAARTAEYPPAARFKWLPEGLWAVDSYVARASDAKRAAFLDAVRNGTIGLDALYGNELTALCRPEELIELTGYARRFAQAYGIAIDSAMISDVPGYTWGVIPVLAQSGVKYFSIGPNASHRIGRTISAWGDKPFYWETPSGQARVLCWVHGKAYSWFHHGVNRDQIHAGSDAPVLTDYLRALEDGGYPYDIVIIRYNIGGDNGPPDAGLPDFVKDWNARYASPRIALATTTEAFAAFEQRYGADLPVVRGDFTPYWEDGAASSARETASVRQAAEQIVQAGALCAIANPRAFAPKDYDRAWREVLLYDEHTWGAYNSISQPESDFAQQQWRIKQAFAQEAYIQSTALLHRPLGSMPGETRHAEAVLVYNTCSWPRTDVAIASKDLATPGDRVLDAQGRPVPSQRLSCGGLAFLAENVPPLGAAKFTIVDGAPEPPQTPVRATNNQLDNGLVRVTVDPASGAIASLTCADAPGDLVDTTAGPGLNDYLYVAGRDPKAPQRNGAAAAGVQDAGPLVGTLRIVTDDAPGCARLTRRVFVYAGLSRVDLADILDKTRVYEKEAVHIGFPFRVPNGVMRLDTPFAVVRPEADQLPGSCKNYFTIQRWADVSNDAFGVTWATLDAPLIEIGAIRCDPVAVGWTERLEPAQTLYAYVMNNYWETNYKAAQEGLTRFRFALRPHGPYDQAAAQRFGVERSQPLIVAPAEPDAPAPESLFAVEGGAVLATAVQPTRDGEGLLVRLFNTRDEEAQTALRWRGLEPKRVWRSDFCEARVTAAQDMLTLAPYEIVTLRADL